MNPTAALPRRAAPRRLALAPSGARTAFGPGLVARERLVRRLMEARDVPLALLAAPAGYGKTTTLLEWAQHDERPFAWIALDWAADDPEQLLAAVESATGPLTKRGSPFVLVLDDLQFLRSAAAIDALKAIVARPPAGAQVVLASRSEPFPLGRLRAHREVLELTSRDFVMTRREATALLALARVELGATEVDALVQRTEGWPAGLYLAAVSLREQPDAAAAAIRFGGDDRIVSDYIADSLLSDLSTAQVTFLRRTSVLDRLSGSLCDAVLDESGRAAPGRPRPRARAAYAREPVARRP
jgi:LuxR family maltose regulon positive regulatory protein